MYEAVSTSDPEHTNTIFDCKKMCPFGNLLHLQTCQILEVKQLYQIIHFQLLRKCVQLAIPYLKTSWWTILFEAYQVWKQSHTKMHLPTVANTIHLLSNLPYEFEVALNGWFTSHTRKHTISNCKVLIPTGDILH